jgi:hypothetical protein
MPDDAEPTVRANPAQVERLDATLKQLREMILSAATYSASIDGPHPDAAHDKLTFVTFRIEHGRTV